MAPYSGDVDMLSVGEAEQISTKKIIKVENLYEESKEQLKLKEDSQDLFAYNQHYDRNAAISIGCGLLVYLIDKSTEGL